MLSLNMCSIRAEYSNESAYERHRLPGTVDHRKFRGPVWDTQLGKRLF
ncbi:hypothetical protein PITCH_A190138 [uncultured Desulfobacterium sp.]|uniref:Uncharacterized protein n=1 Tax=uncultured Desulfobacterium sp. TaxID=201089 RepID=A0A445MW01_9BACT|nr:hypothetical protein PITCH_A190138 [uncultured Desulfobacterium sp.]